MSLKTSRGTNTADGPPERGKTLSPSNATLRSPAPRDGSRKFSLSRFRFGPDELPDDDFNKAVAQSQQKISKMRYEMGVTAAEVIGCVRREMQPLQQMLQQLQEKLRCLNADMETNCPPEGHRHTEGSLALDSARTNPCSKDKICEGGHQEVRFQKQEFYEGSPGCPPNMADRKDLCEDSSRDQPMEGALKRVKPKKGSTFRRIRPLYPLGMRKPATRRYPALLGNNVTPSLRTSSTRGNDATRSTIVND